MYNVQYMLALGENFGDKNLLLHGALLQETKKLEIRRFRAFKNIQIKTN
jgi:hypothetical protein